MPVLSCKKIKKLIEDEHLASLEYNEIATDFIKEGQSEKVDMFSNMAKDERKHEKNLKKLYAERCYGRK